MVTTRRWLLAAREPGEAREARQFRMDAIELPEPELGQMLLRTRWLGFEPAQTALLHRDEGAVMRGPAVSEVSQSNEGPFAPGTCLVGNSEWSEWRISDGAGLIPAEPSLPPTAMLSVLGPPSIAAWRALFEQGRLVLGDTVVIADAASAIGDMAGQLARAAGCRVIALAADPHVRERLQARGFNAVLDPFTEDFAVQIAAAAPNGVDLRVSEDDLARAQAIDADCTTRIRRRLAVLVRENRLRASEDIAHGFEAAPRAFRRMLAGESDGAPILALD